MSIQVAPSSSASQHAFLSTISALCKQGQIHGALHTLELMNQQGLPLSSDMIYSVIQACFQRKDLPSARRISAFVDSSGLSYITFLKDNLIRLFARCGSLQDARSVFSNVGKPTIYTWNSFISACTQCGELQEALATYGNMRKANFKPDKITFLSIIQACSGIGSSIMARRVHDEVIKHGLESDIGISNTLLDMYAKCGSLAEALFIFDCVSSPNIVTWTALIASFANHNDGLRALQHFERMRNQGISPNLLTFSSVMKACGSLQDLDHSYFIHDMFVRANFKMDMVLGSTLVDMYSRCGSTKDARQVFDDLESRDLVSWGAMISGYTMQEDAVSALGLFEKMEQQNVKPNRVILLSAIKACGSLRAIQKGKSLHGQVIESFLESDHAVGSALTDMYVKCGSLKEACKVFGGLRDPDAVMWGTLVSGYAAEESSESVLRCLEEMQQHGVRPGEAIFTNILAACSQAGFLEGTSQYLRKMGEYGIAPTIEHLGCMVDLFARAGKLEEAMAVLGTMPFCPDTIFWRSLLTCCKTYSNLDVGRRCFNEAGMLDAGDASLYILMSNMYAGSNKWEDVDHVENLRMCAGAHKMPGMAWIEVGSKVHHFIVSNGVSQCSNYEISAKFHRMVRSIKDGAGFVPQSESVLSMLVEDSKDGG